MTATTSPPYVIVRKDAERNVAVDMRASMRGSEVLVDPPTVAELNTPPSGMTFSSIAVNLTTIEVRGRDVPPGGAVQFKVSDIANAGDWEIEVTCATNSTPSQSLKESFILRVVD